MSVPQSSTTGMTHFGSIPAAAVYTISFSPRSSWNPRPAAAPGDPPRKGGRRVTSRSPRGAAHPGNGVIAPFHGGRPRNRGVKDTRRPPFSAPSSRRRPSETAIRTASPALTPRPSRPGGACAGGRGPRSGRCARAGAAMTGDGPRVVGNGAPGGSFRPAPGDRPDETAESCGCRRGRPARGGERSSRSARTGAGAPRPPPDRKNTAPRDLTRAREPGPAISAGAETAHRRRQRRTRAARRR